MNGKGWYIIFSILQGIIIILFVTILSTPIGSIGRITTIEQRLTKIETQIEYINKSIDRLASEIETSNRLLKQSK